MKFTGNKHIYRQKRKLYKRKGSCNRCGNCCSFRPMLRSYNWKTKIILFILHPTVFFGWVFGMKCRFLRFEFNGEKRDRAYCLNYPNRPWFCRAFPSEPSELIEECGYYFKRKK